MFMAGKGGEKIEKSGNERMSRTVSGMTELNKEPEPAYLPLHLDLGIKDPGSTDIKEEEEGSAFAKSVFAVKKSNRVDLHGTNGSASGGSGSVSASDLLSNLKIAFPSSKRAMNCFLSDLKSLDALSSVAQRAAVSAG